MLDTDGIGEAVAIGLHGGWEFLIGFVQAASLHYGGGARDRSARCSQSGGDALDCQVE